jgi:hypothetical protein
MLGEMIINRLAQAAAGLAFGATSAGGVIPGHSVQARTRGWRR